MKGCIMSVFEILVIFTDWLWKITLEVSFCVLLILLVRRFFGRFFGARMCRLLWLILFVRCLIPWSFPVQYHPAGLLHDIDIAFDPKPTTMPLPLPETVASPEIPSGPALTPKPILPFTGFGFMLKTPRIALAGLWGLGMVTLLGLTLYRNQRVAHAATNAAIPVPSWLQEIFLDCRSRLNIKVWPVLIITSGITSPSLMGAVRPCILLPRDLVEEDNRERLHHILLHELVHLKQGDIWFSWFWTFLWLLQWFNPLLWLAGRSMYLDREMACDERVLGLLEPEGRIEYSRSLVELFKKLSLPAHCPSLAGVVEQKTNIERRLTMIKRYQTGTTRRLIIGTLAMATLLAISLTSFAASKQTLTLSSDKAELMGRVEHFFLHNFRDITARKSIEWEEAKIDKKDSRSIRYMYEALIWDKEWKIMNQIFTFDTNGKFVNYKNVSGYPKNKKVSKIDTSTKEGMIALVEKFFSRNWRDVTARKIIEWGAVRTDKEGNRSIRCKLEATIWDKEKKIMNQIFTFTPAGEFVSVKDAPASLSVSHALTTPKIKIDTPENTVIGFTRAAASGDIKTAMAYMLPGGVDYEDIHEILTAQPSSSAKYQFRQLLEAVDPNIPVKIVSQQEKGDYMKVVWLLTFKRTVKLGKEPKEMVFKPGSTFEFDATLKRTEQGWLIDNI